MKRRAENLLVIIIILCSTSFYSFSALGPLQKLAELLGIGLIVIFILLYLAYADPNHIRKHFIIPIVLIIFSFFSSVFMAQYLHDQDFGKTIYAQRALFYYLFYVLLHQLKVKISDLESIFYALGIVHIIFYLVQYFAYPTIIFEGYVREDRGTIRIYLSGADYMIIAMFISIQNFFRTNKLKHFVFPILSISILILMGGRQSLAIMILVIVLFLIFDRKIRSRILLIFLGFIGVITLFVIFQPIFEALFAKTIQDMQLAEDYIRVKAARFFLTDFMEQPLAYVFGNGNAYSSDYAREMYKYNQYRGYYISDLGLIGNYVIYGLFFVLGVITLCVKTLTIRIKENHMYIKYFFIAVILSFLGGGGMSSTDTICAIVPLLYIIDSSSHSLTKNSEI